MDQGVQCSSSSPRLHCVRVFSVITTHCAVRTRPLCTCVMAVMVSGAPTDPGFVYGDLFYSCTPALWTFYSFWIFNFFL